MTIDSKTMITELQLGLGLVQAIAPAAAAGGPQAAAIGQVVSAVAGLASGYLESAQAAADVMQSSDLATIQGLTDQLQAENNQLAARIAGG